MSTLEAQIAEVLGEAWDAGNCTGLDGWVGPSRGAGEVDSEAMDSRERDTAKLAAMLAPVIREREAEAWDKGADLATRIYPLDYDGNNPYRADNLEKP